MALHCLERGTGAPIVLLHAFPLSSAMWAEEATPLSKLGRVLAPDLPGFGRSARLESPSIAAMAKAVADLMDQRGISEPAVIAGLSMGGYVAFEFLRQFPLRVKGLGLFSTKAAPDSPEQKEGRLKLIEKLKKEGIGVLKQASLPKLVGKTTAQSRPAVVQTVERLGLSADVGGVADALAAMAGRVDSRDLLAGITFPALVVAGAEDQVIPSEESRQMAAAIKNARIEVIPAAGHLANLETPEAFIKNFQSWLTEVL